MRRPSGPPKRILSKSGAVGAAISVFLSFGYTEVLIKWSKCLCCPRDVDCKLQLSHGYGIFRVNHSPEMAESKQNICKNDFPLYRAEDISVPLLHLAGDLIRRFSFRHCLPHRGASSKHSPTLAPSITPLRPSPSWELLLHFATAPAAYFSPDGSPSQSWDRGYRKPGMKLHPKPLWSSGRSQRRLLQSG